MLPPNIGKSQELDQDPRPKLSPEQEDTTTQSTPKTPTTYALFERCIPLLVLRFWNFGAGVVVQFSVPILVVHAQALGFGVESSLQRWARREDRSQDGTNALCRIKACKEQLKSAKTCQRHEEPRHTTHDRHRPRKELYN
eukprot:1394865-Amphidinium_carterae.1